MTTNSAPLPLSRSMYARREDQVRLRVLAERERRTTAEQLAIVLDEAAERRGLDPETMEPIDAAQRADS